MEDRPSHHLFLIGARGSGKTTVGRALAALAELPFVDLDEQIESASGRSIVEIFASDGEEAFRDWESRQLKQVAEQAPSVVSLGGGAVLRESNRRLIAEHGQVVWLQAAPSQLRTRMESDVKAGHSRPALTSAADAISEIESVLRERKPVYEATADYSLDTEQRSPEELAAEILQWWRKQ